MLCNIIIFIVSRYKKALGLIVTTYTGYIEIFDNIDFKSVWSNKGDLSAGTKD